MNTKEMMNWILYGNRQGNFSKVSGKTTTEYNDFIKSVFSKKCECCEKVDKLEHCDNTMCHECWLQETIDEK